MMLFSKNAEEIGKIARSLQDCGCCTRCTLRYLGLKDTYSYRKSLQEMQEEVEKLIDVGVTNLPQAEASKSCEANSGLSDLIETDTVKSDCDKSVVSNERLGDCKTDSEEDCNDASRKPKTGDEMNSDCNLDSNADTSKEKVDFKGTDSSKVNVCKSVEENTNASDSRDCNNSINTPNIGDVKLTKPFTVNTEYVETKANSNVTSCEVMDTSEPVKNVTGLVDKEKPASVKKEEASGQQTCQQTTCIVCLGILEEFTSDDFLQKIKVSSVDEGFEFTNYICSLMIPVSIILREHAMMLFLKDTFGSVYDNVKFLDIPTIKDVWKWRNGPILKEILGAPFDQKSTFDIILNFIYPDSDRECSFLLGLMSDTFRKRKQDRRNNKKGAFQVYNRANVTKAVLEMSTKEFKSHFQCPPKVPTKQCTCDIKCQNEAIFIAGRYNKYSRTLSQTPWVIEGKRKSETSVEELICTEIDKTFRPAEHKFSSAGREDVDVLMLGDGRPFIVELTNPRRVNFTQEEMTNIQTEANSATKDIHIRDLQIVSREETEKLKEGEIDKIKNYSALCWSKTPLSAEQLYKLTEMKELKLLQKTPIRVLHRRPLSTREKCIHSMTVEKVDEYHFRLGLKTQAGTYPFISSPQ